MHIGVIGLGRMGAAMAANLLKDGHEVTVYNRNPARATPLAAQGAKVAKSVAAACRTQAVLTMLADDPAVEAIVLGTGGVIESLAPGALHISSSTISAALSERLTRLHADAHQQYVSAPVFGRPDVAAAGKLFVVAAGEHQALETARPMFASIGQKTFIVSQTPRLANVAKLSGNFLIASMIESLGEALALVSKAGLDPHQYVELLTSSVFNVPAYHTYGNLIASHRFEPAFAAPLGYKDIRLMLAVADELRVPLPFAGVLRDRFLALMARGGEGLDWSAIAGLASADAGLARNCRK